MRSLTLALGILMAVLLFIAYREAPDHRQWLKEHPRYMLVKFVPIVRG